MVSGFLMTHSRNLQPNNQPTEKPPDRGGSIPDLHFKTLPVILTRISRLCIDQLGKDYISDAFFVMQYFHLYLHFLLVTLFFLNSHDFYRPFNHHAF